MLDDVALIERMNKLIEVGEGPESKMWTAEQNLSFVMGACRGIKSNAERRIKEFEDAYAPKDVLKDEEPWLVTGYKELDKASQL